MRGLEKNHMKKEQTKIQRDKEKNKERNTHQLLDQLGPEGRVGEKHEWLQILH